MLIDTFTFNGEFDMLQFRMHVLGPLVDKFVIVEADCTFSGNPKPYRFAEMSSSFDITNPKISFHPVHIDPSLIDRYAKPPTMYDPGHSCWRIETIQRNMIDDSTRHYPDDTIVLMGDVDEIPTREALQYAIESKALNATNTIAFRQWMFGYNLKRMGTQSWNGTVITNAKTLREITPQTLRERRNEMPYIDKGGWHLSYFMTPAEIKAKIESFSHQEYNKPEYTDIVHIAECINTGEDLFGRDAPGISVTQDQFPEYFRQYAPESWWGDDDKTQTI